MHAYMYGTHHDPPHEALAHESAPLVQEALLESERRRVEGVREEQRTALALLLLRRTIPP
jgi:hypothetical protein